jgi:hypothetical protein
MAFQKPFALTSLGDYRVRAKSNQQFPFEAQGATGLASLNNAKDRIRNDANPSRRSTRKTPEVSFR